MQKDNRFQNQPWYIKLWRFRWYLLIPFKAIRIWWHERNRPMRDKDDWSLTFKQSWGLATGIVQGPMQWYYTWDEFEEHHKQRDEKAYKITFRKDSDRLVWVKVDSNPEWVGCGYNKEQALKSLRESVEFCHGPFNIKDWWLSKHIKFSKNGKL